MVPLQHFSKQLQVEGCLLSKNPHSLTILGVFGFSQIATRCSARQYARDNMEMLATSSCCR